MSAAVCYFLVYFAEALILLQYSSNVFEYKISIMAPIGTAVLGYGEGDVLDWVVPSGVVQYQIEKIIYQPEASGNYEL